MSNTVLKATFIAALSSILATACLAQNPSRSASVAPHIPDIRAPAVLHVVPTHRPVGDLLSFPQTPTTADAPAQPTRSDVMAGICNGAGGGASSTPEGTVECITPDGDHALDPTPAPDD